MMNQEVVNYIHQAQQHGLADFEIKQNLLSAGWEAAVVEESFVFVRAADNKNTALPRDPIASNPPTSAGGFNSAINRPADATPLSHIPGPIVSEASFTQNSRKAAFKKPLSWVVVATVLLIGGGAYAYYATVLNNPIKIWQKFTQSSQNLIYSSNYSFSYTDKAGTGQQASASTGSLFNISDIKLGLNGSAYVNVSDPNSPQASSTLQYSFSSGNTSFSTGLGYIMLGHVLYLNVGDNPFLSQIGAAASDGKKTSWVKIDLYELEKQASSSPEYANFLQQLASPDFKAALEKIWTNATIIKVDKYVGKETVNGVTTMHFQNSVDKAALKSLISQYIDQISKTMQGSGTGIDQKGMDTAKEVISQLLDKVQIQQLETWVGVKDLKLYKVHLVTNAPSVISLIKNASSLTSFQSNDTKRVTDIREMSSALDLYRSDHNGYPDGKDGQPIGIAPNYISAWPSAPAADGKCTDYYNTYWYQPMGNKHVDQGKTVYDSYQLTFCLGSDVAGYKAGIAKLTPGKLEGQIQDNIPCPTTPDQCVNNSGSNDVASELTQKVKDFVSKIDFSAQVQADVSYSNYGKTMVLAAPADSFDIFNKAIGQAAQAGDASTLASIRQLASALELYFNDQSSYPDQLSELTPNYIAKIPASPTASGNCSQDDSNFNYKKSSSTNYTLTFCLGSDTGGYSAGKHSLSPQGIQ